MEDEKSIEIGPVDHITVDAIGKPGERVFFLQATHQFRTVTLLVEKVQVQTLAMGVEQFLSEIATRYPDLDDPSGDFIEERMHIQPPVDPLFRAGDLGLSYDTDKDLLILVVNEALQGEVEEGEEEEVEQEGVEEEEGREVRFLCSRAQLRSMARWSIELANRGRPICPQCGEPMEPEGHFCPKKNGHKH